MRRDSDSKLTRRSPVIYRANHARRRCSVNNRLAPGVTRHGAPEQDAQGALAQLLVRPHRRPSWSARSRGPRRGLKVVAAHRRERLLAIAEWIANSAAPSRASYHSDASDDLAQQQRDGYDCIALQEIWVRADFDAVATRAKEAGLLYSRFFYSWVHCVERARVGELTCVPVRSGAIGSGLALLSAHPISSAFMMPYPLNGYPLHFIAGDFFAGKGVCGITIDVERVGMVDVLNTHMFAPGGEGEGVDGAHRVAQAWELARLATEKTERGRHVIVVRRARAPGPRSRRSQPPPHRWATSTLSHNPSSCAFLPPTGL